MPAKVVGVDDVLKGLSFINEDMYARIKDAVRPAMLGVEAKAKGLYLVTARYYRAGQNRYHLL